ncbi:MAG: glycosyltransferase family 39 protein [Chloroflexi bacterium]|nr:glycosyltransferase family 39 protein [Chloroflexota bacterium]
MKEPVEPTVLDYVKSKLKFWQTGQIEIPPLPVEEQAVEQVEELPVVRTPFPWPSLLALGLALFAQYTFEPGFNAPRSWVLGTVLYLAALGLLIFAYRRGEWTLHPLPASESAQDPLIVRWVAFVASLILGGVTFYLMGGNLFSALNLTLWVLTFFTHLRAFWLRDPQAEPLWNRAKRFFARQSWDIRITRWALLIVAVAALILYFRVYQLSEVPPDMTSDHAEKLEDVFDILNGKFSIYFPRNTGREPLYVYLSALVAYLFTGVSFQTLKIAAVLGGLATLPYLYFLGKELGAKRIGLLAVLFAGIAYWPNVIERFGLRISFYPLFVAATFYYLIRGLRRQNRNDMILAGISLGLGLNGYTPFRIVPFVIVAAFIIYIIHARSGQERKQAVLWLGLLALTSWVIFIPQARFALENPDLYGFRALSRMSSVEQPLPGPVWQLLLQNLWNALKMFNWSDGGIWVHSVPGRPALDVVSGALFLIGAALVLIRYIRQRQWTDLFLLLSIPLLLMPSILSLAFPDENPSLNRTGGAIIPVFLLVGLAVDGLLAGFAGGAESAQSQDVSEGNRPVKVRAAHPVLMFFVMAGLLFISCVQNYNLVFHEYYLQYRGSAWNTSEMGVVLKQFALTQGSSENAWIVPFPFWVDTRLPPMWAGIPERGDMAIRPESLPNTLSITDNKLFIFKITDTETMAKLRELYPQGTLNIYKSARGENWNFYIYVVPAVETISSVQ